MNAHEIDLDVMFGIQVLTDWSRSENNQFKRQKCRYLVLPDDASSHGQPQGGTIWHQDLHNLSLKTDVKQVFVHFEAFAQHTLCIDL